ncbi:MAG: TIGR02444 family protein [Xanthobacteraceae bacterium]
MSGSAPAPQAQGSAFWRFSLGFYRLEGVGEACIALQEQSGVDVNLLLFLLWQAGEKHVASQAEIAALEGRISPWREMTVVPLRNVRRALKSPPQLVPASSAEALRTRIKAVELEAERLQQEAMHEVARSAPLASSTASAQEAARANVAAYERICRAPFAPSAVATLLAAFGRLEHNTGR